MPNISQHPRAGHSSSAAAPRPATSSTTSPHHSPPAVQTCRQSVQRDASLPSNSTMHTSHGSSCILLEKYWQGEQQQAAHADSGDAAAQVQATRQTLGRRRPACQGKLPADAAADTHERAIVDVASGKAEARAKRVKAEERVSWVPGCRVQGQSKRAHHCPQTYGSTMRHAPRHHHHCAWLPAPCATCRLNSCRTR